MVIKKKRGKHGQVAIFVIIAILIVGVLLVLFVPQINKVFIPQPLDLEVKECLEESVEEYATWLRTLDDLENILEEAEQKMRSLGVIRDSEKNQTQERKSYESVSPRSRNRIKVAAVNR